MTHSKQNKETIHWWWNFTYPVRLPSTAAPILEFEFVRCPGDSWWCCKKQLHRQQITFVEQATAGLNIESERSNTQQKTMQHRLTWWFTVSIDRKCTVETEEANRHMMMANKFDWCMIGITTHNILKPSYDPHASAWLGALNQSDATVPEKHEEWKFCQVSKRWASN